MQAHLMKRQRTTDAAQSRERYVQTSVVTLYFELASLFFCEKYAKKACRITAGIAMLYIYFNFTPLNFA